MKPDKFLGQHFLINRRVLGKIIDAADLKKTDSVLEIGPGAGIVTRGLVSRVKKVIAVEKDFRLFSFLQKMLRAEGIKNVVLIYDDALRINAGALGLKNARYKIVANLPYYLTGRFFRKFLEIEVAKPKEMVVMIQKEVAQRILAKPPHMSLLALSVRVFGKPELVSYVPRSAFRPAPKVDSAILKISGISDAFFSRHKIKNEVFFRLLRAGFAHPRKTILNNLSSGLPHFGKGEIEILLEKVGISSNARAETLDSKGWKALYFQLFSRH